MKTAVDMIAAARAAQADKEGVRVPVRFPSTLIVRARECANQVGDSLGDWVNIVCRRFVANGSCVAKRDKSELATRKDSMCITVRAPQGMSADHIKEAVLQACEYCEQKAVPCTPQDCPEYKVEEPD